jgi:hypothetical protein
MQRCKRSFQKYLNLKLEVKLISAYNYPNIGMYLLIAIILGSTITFVAIIYGKSFRLPINKASRKSYALLSELPDIVEQDYMEINEI